jgi:hypothetical protein
VVIANAADEWVELVRDKDVIVVQTKCSRLGTYLGGQAVFSPGLVRDWLPVRSVTSVAVCSESDDELRRLIESLGVEVVVLAGYAARKEGKSPLRPLRERYWKALGGTLVERYPIAAGHHAEALILPDWETQKLAPGSAVPIDGEHVVIVQTNAGLGMYVTGQALLTYELLQKHHRPAELRSVAVVPRDDMVIRHLYDPFPFLERRVL